jgi:hypothetical protein
MTVAVKCFRLNATGQLYLLTIFELSVPVFKLSLVVFILSGPVVKLSVFVFTVLLIIVTSFNLVQFSEKFESKLSSR